jgi:hypothetical protein
VLRGFNAGRARISALLSLFFPVVKAVEEEEEAEEDMRFPF